MCVHKQKENAVTLKTMKGDGESWRERQREGGREEGGKKGQRKREREKRVHEFSYYHSVIHKELSDSHLGSCPAALSVLPHLPPLPFHHSCHWVGLSPPLPLLQQAYLCQCDQCQEQWLSGCSRRRNGGQTGLYGYTSICVCVHMQKRKWRD